MSDLIGNAYYAGLAGRNADRANANQRAANDAMDVARYNRRIAEEQSDRADQWMDYARGLEQQVRKWQAEAVESEAISRAKNQILRDHTGDDFRQFVNDEQYQEIKAQKIQEVCNEWGVNPFEK